MPSPRLAFPCRRPAVSALARASAAPFRSSPRLLRVSALLAAAALAAFLAAIPTGVPSPVSALLAAPVSAPVSAPTACTAPGSLSCGVCRLPTAPPVWAVTVTVAVAVAVARTSLLRAEVSVPLPFVVFQQVLLELPRFAVVSEEGCPRRRRFRADFCDVPLLATASTPLFRGDGAHREARCPPVVTSTSVAPEEPLHGPAALAVLVCTLSRSTSLVPSSVVVAGLFLVGVVGISLPLRVRLDLLSSDGHSFGHLISRFPCTLQADLALR